MSDPVRVSLYEAKTHLSELGDRAASGEIIVVTKRGRPRFRMVPMDSDLPDRMPGGNPLGITFLAEDFDAPNAEIEREFGEPA